MESDFSTPKAVSAITWSFLLDKSQALEMFEYSVVYYKIMAGKLLFLFLQIDLIKTLDKLYGL